MSELNLKCHYQMVRSETQHGEEFTVHEAFSTDKGELYMLCPVPVYVVGDSKEDVSELTSMIEKDIVKYGSVDIVTIRPQFEKYSEYTTVPIELELQLEMDAMNVEEEIIEQEDYHDKDGKVLDLIEFMKKKK